MKKFEAIKKKKQEDIEAAERLLASVASSDRQELERKAMLKEEIRMRLVERAEQVSSLEEKEYHLDRLKDSLKLRVSNFEQIDRLFEQLKEKRRGHFEEVRKASVSANGPQLLQRWDGSRTSKELSQEEEDFEADCRFVDCQIEQQLSSLDIKSEDDFCDLGDYIEAQNHLAAVDAKLHRRLVEVESCLMLRLREQEKGVSNARLTLEETNKGMLDYLDEEDCLIHRHHEVMADRSGAMKLFRQLHRAEYSQLEALKREACELQGQAERLSREQTALQEAIDMAEARKYLVTFWKSNHGIIKELNHLQEEIEKKQRQKSQVDSQIIKCNFSNSSSFADKIQMQSVRSFHQASQSRPGSTKRQQSTSNQESQAESPKFHNASQNTTDKFMMFSNYNSVASHKPLHKHSSVDSNNSFKIPQDNLRYFEQKKRHLQQTEDPDPDKSSHLNTERTRKGKGGNSSSEQAAPEKLFESALKAGQLRSPNPVRSVSGSKKSATLSAFTPASIREAGMGRPPQDNSYFTRALAGHRERHSALSSKERTADAATGAATDRTVKHVSPFQRAGKKENPVQIGKSLKEKLQRELEAVKTKIQSALQAAPGLQSSKSYLQAAGEEKKQSKLGFLKELFAQAGPGASQLAHKQAHSHFEAQVLCRFDERARTRLGAFNPLEAKHKPPRVFGFREVLLRETNDIFTIAVG